MAKKNPITIDDFLKIEAVNDGRNSGSIESGPSDAATIGAIDDHSVIIPGDPDGGSYGFVRGNSAEIDDAGDESFDLPLGVDDHKPGGKSHRQQTGGVGTGGKRRRGRAGANKGSAETEASTSSDIDTPPREVSYDKLGSSPSDKKSAKNQELTLKFFAEFWGLAFHGASVFSRDPEWKLPQEDANELAERTERWLGSLDAKRLAAARKKIAKIQPLLSLGMALGAIVIPRVSHTRSLKRAANLQQKQTTNGNGQAPRAEAPPAAANSHVVDEQAGKRPSENVVGPIEFRGRSIRREDGSIFPNDSDA